MVSRSFLPITAFGWMRFSDGSHHTRKHALKSGRSKCVKTSSMLKSAQCFLMCIQNFATQTSKATAWKNFYFSFLFFLFCIFNVRSSLGFAKFDFFNLWYFKWIIQYLNVTPLNNKFEKRLSTVYQTISNFLPLLIITSYSAAHVSSSSYPYF